MFKRLCFSILFVICITGLSFAQSGNIRSGFIGAVEDSFEKDYRNTPFPRDRTPQIIEEKELLKNLPSEKSADTVFVSNFEFMGNRVILKDDLKMLLLDYVERNLTLAELNEVAEIITSYYRKKGYIISYAYIPPQVVQNSTVIVNIVEGEIGDVIIEGLSDYKKEFILKYLAPLQSGIVLETSVLERRLLLLNSFMDLRVNATLRPGKRPGTSDIIIYAQDTNPYRANIGFDNLGSYQTNEYRFSGSAMIGNIITSGDRLAINLSMGLETLNPLDLFYGRLDYRLPFGADGLKAGIAYARSNYRATKDFEPLGLNGYSNEANLYFEYPLLLRSQGTLNLGASFNFKQTEDIVDIFKTSLSEDLLFDIGLSLYGEAYPWQGANMYYSLSFNQGLNGFLGGSHYDENSSNPYAGGYFEKLKLDFEYHQFITWFFRIRTFFSAQWISDTTFSPERFYIGGMYSVRGFDSGIESGDYGYRLSIETEFDMGIPQAKILFFYDRGQIGNADPDFSGQETASLDSVGIGLRFYPWKGFYIKVDYGYPIMSSNNHDASWGKVYGRIGYDF